MSDSPTGQKIVPRCIMIHRCETGADATAVKNAESEASCGYHYFIAKDGSCAQMYLDNDLIWHALTWSRHAIGIAVFGDFDPDDHSRNDRANVAQESALVSLCVNLWKKYGPLPIIGHTDVPRSTAFPGKRCPGANLSTREIELRVLQAYVLPPQTIS